ncbi:hypothetical protein JAAARDRAFT_202341 [Jaapia argillacea MUCL 33604]|uniref:Uncharacterized protein n=1 Tax=Jaapia argillacea MUCL 33604 TaxID=933084 RepID=A0A067QQZ0_9AGAM|nr:hypothetical protein JAAARDRAFT_202341 [Jaapia argillacea MUCL 33604]
MVYQTLSIPFVFEQRDTTIPVDHWKWSLESRLKLNTEGAEEINNCFVTSIDYCKKKKGKMHEYLGIRVEHRPSKATTFIVAERVWEPSSSGSSSANSAETSRVASPASYDIPAQDRVVFTSSPPKGDRLLANLAFPNSSLPVLHLAFVLTAVNTIWGRYHVYETQCYWFATVVYESLQGLFNGIHTPHKSGRCQYLSCKWVGDTEKVVEEVRAAFNTTLNEYVEGQAQRAAKENEADMLRQALQASEERNRALEQQLGSPTT